jgi:ketosteroid isomerase-like protein
MKGHWVLFSLLLLIAPARGEDIPSAMEAINAKFLESFNTPNTAGFPALYTDDAVLIFHGAPPITGPEAIKRFWESRISAGARDHTFDIIETWSDGKLAYQLSKAGVQLVRPTGEKTAISGHTLRVFEVQSDGTWKTKVHMFNVLSAPQRVFPAPRRKPHWRMNLTARPGRICSLERLRAAESWRRRGAVASCSAFARSSKGGGQGQGERP